MTARLISAAALVLLVTLIIFLFPDWVFDLTVTGFVGLGLVEFFRLVRRKGILIYRGFGIVAGIIIPVFMYFKFEPTKIWDLALVAAALICLFILQFTRRDNSQAIVGVSTTLFGILYVSWLLSYLIKLKHLPEGTALVAFLLLVTKSGDMAAFLVGTKMGRHLLIRRISPEKTIEGTVGGVVFSVLCALVGGKFLLSAAGTFHLAILGLLIGGLGQLGDLSESLIKRDCRVKDSSSLIPGLGGVLDLIDSILFTAPVFYFYVLVFTRQLGLAALP